MIFERNLHLMYSRSSLLLIDMDMTCCPSTCRARIRQLFCTNTSQQTENRRLVVFNVHRVVKLDVFGEGVRDVAGYIPEFRHS